MNMNGEQRAKKSENKISIPLQRNWKCLTSMHILMLSKRGQGARARNRVFPGKHSSLADMRIFVQRIYQFNWYTFQIRSKMVRHQRARCGGKTLSHFHKPNYAGYMPTARTIKHAWDRAATQISSFSCFHERAGGRWAVSIWILLHNLTLSQSISIHARNFARERTRSFQARFYSFKSRHIADMFFDAADFPWHTYVMRVDGWKN